MVTVRKSWIAVAVLCLVLLLVSGCGGSSKGAAQDSASKLKTECITSSLSAATGSPALVRYPVLMRDTKHAVSRICTLAIGGGGLRPGQSKAKMHEVVQGVLRTHANVFGPLCADGFVIGLRRVPQAMTALIKNPREVGRRLCYYVLAEHPLTASGLIDPTAVGKVLNAHPDFGAPLMYAAILAQYNSSIPLSRRDFSKVAHVLAVQVLKRRLAYTTGFSPSDYHMREPATGNLVRHLMLKMAIEGKIHIHH